jgi:hypothetical protein
VEGGRCQVEGPVQPNKTTNSSGEEGQDVGRDTLPAVAGLFPRVLRPRSLSYLIYTRHVNFVFIRRDWLVVLSPPRRL